MDTKELESLNLLHYSPVDENGDVLSPPFPVVHNHLLCLDHVEGEVVVLAPHSQVSDLLPIGCLIVVGDQAYHCCVIGKLDDGVGVIPGHAVMSKQGVPWRMCCLPTLATWGWPVRKSRIQLEREVFSPRVLSLVMSCEGTMVLNAEL
jgi:hypothetical protein